MEKSCLTRGAASQQSSSSENHAAACPSRLGAFTQHTHQRNPTGGTFSDLETQASQAMARVVYKEMWRLNFVEVEQLCRRLLNAFIHSLMHGSPASFRHEIQQILEHIDVVEMICTPGKAQSPC